MSGNGYRNSYRPNNEGSSYTTNNYRQHNYNSTSNGLSNYKPNNRSYNNVSNGNTNANNYNNGAYQAQRKPFNNKRGNFESRYQNPRSYQTAYNQTNQNAYNQDGQQQTEDKSQQKQLWMGDLDPSWDELTISKIWAAFGEVPTSVKIIRDKTGDSKPMYSFVTFASQAAVSSAILKNGLQVPGSTKTFKLNWATGATNSFSASTSKFGSIQNANLNMGRTQSRPQNDFSVFVGDLAPDVTDSSLFNAFNQAYPNQIKQVKVMTNPVTRLPKGFGFVRFNTSIVQQKALVEMNGFVLGSRPIRVGLASSQPAAPTNSSAKVDGIPKKSDSTNIPQPQPSLNALTDPQNSTILIKGLSSNINEKDLVSHFITFGHIIYCKIYSHTQEGFIKFYSREEAETAMLFMYGYIINDCHLKLTWGKSKIDESKPMKHDPDIDLTKYIKNKMAPKLYGTLGFSNVNFDSLSKDLISDFPSGLVEIGEPLDVSRINEIYMKTKLYEEKVLSSAMH